MATDRPLTPDILTCGLTAQVAPGFLVRVGSAPRPSVPLGRGAPGLEKQLNDDLVEDTCSLTFIENTPCIIHVPVLQCFVNLRHLGGSTSLCRTVAAAQPGEASRK